MFDEIMLSVQSYDKGLPIMRTMFTEFPDDPATYTLDDQWMVGQSLLVKPVTNAGQTTAEVYLPGPEPWFDLQTLHKYGPSAQGQRTTVKAPLERIPAFIRAGTGLLFIICIVF